MNDNAVLAFFDYCAQKYGQSDKASNPDSHYRELEIRRVIEQLPETGRLLDVGCGNGYSTIRYKKARPNVTFFGMDFSNEMLAHARAADPSIEWWHGDVLSDFPPIKFDTIVSCRCLINLSSWPQQKKALLNMKARLKQGGKIILVENFLDGLQRLNGVRAAFGLHPIEVRWHNRYLLFSEFLPFAEGEFGYAPDLSGMGERPQNIGNLYYLLSRVIAAKLALLEGKEPDYDNAVNQLAVDMPHVDGPYSPNYLIVLETSP